MTDAELIHAYRTSIYEHQRAVWRHAEREELTAIRRRQAALELDAHDRLSPGLRQISRDSLLSPVTLLELAMSYRSERALLAKATQMAREIAAQEKAEIRRQLEETVSP